ncbi:MAG: Rrf2 family transcriptional regulator [Candidatus Sumerlaeia bacterium]|nr:Rrf2 family transcriptional regulator [Candidatus Sumerlaeia bacterium]
MISTTGEYALRAAVYLAQHHGSPKTTAQIAEGTQVPQGYLSKVLQAMVRAELIHGQRGLGGGFTLQREPSKINILQVLKAVDAAPQRIKRCPLGHKGHTSLCPLHKLLDQSIATTENAFRQTDLQTLLKSTDGITALCDK